MFRRFQHIATLTALMAGFAFTSSALAKSTYEVRAKLFGESITKGQIRYEEKPKKGTLLRKFKVEVEKALPLQTFEVAVNGKIVGSLTTNTFGFGEFQLRTPQFIDSPGDGLPMPADFPKLGKNDIVTVGALSGVFFNTQKASMQKFRLRGDFSGGLTSGHVKYREQFKNGLGLERRFIVEVEDAVQGTSFDIVVNDEIVGTLVMGAAETEFELRTAKFIDSPGDGQPMPNSFPSLKVGDVVTVGSMTATLQLDNGGGNGNGNGGGGSGGNGGGGNDDPPGDDNGGNGGGGGGNDDPPGDDNGGGNSGPG